MGTSRHSRRYWTEKLAEYWDSELTLSDYCEIMELPYRAALRWVQIFKKENQEQAPETYELIEITPSTETDITARSDSTPRNDSGIRIQVNGITIELDRGFDCETLKSVLEITRFTDA